MWRRISSLRAKSTQELVGGLVLMGAAAFAYWSVRNLGGLHDSTFGPGTAPRIFSALLFGLGSCVAARALLVVGPSMPTFYWRGPLFVSAAIILFACMIRPAGLLLTAFLSFAVAAMGTNEVRWNEALGVAVLLTGGCAVLFYYVLGLPIALFPYNGTH